MDGRDDVAAVILAAGESRRYGSAKQLAMLEGRTLLEHVLELASEAGLRPIVAVVPVWLTRPASMSDGETLRWVRNPSPEEGMGHSLRLGFAALPPQVAAAMILLGDQPTVSVDHLRALRAARGDRPFVATLHGDVAAPPVLVERSHFPVVESASGDIGLRDLLRSGPELVTTVRAAAPFPDIDAPDDLARISDT